MTDTVDSSSNEIGSNEFLLVNNEFSSPFVVSILQFSKSLEILNCKVHKFYIPWKSTVLQFLLVFISYPAFPRRHGQLENDIAAYDEEIVRLEDAASIIAKAQEDNKKNQGLMSKSLVSMV